MGEQSVGALPSQSLLPFQNSSWPITKWTASMAEITSIAAMAYDLSPAFHPLTSFQRLQKLSLQEYLRQFIKRAGIPPRYCLHAQPHHPCSLDVRILLQRDPLDQILLSFIQFCQAGLHVMHEDHHVVEAVYAIVRHLATKHLTSQQRWCSSRLHRQTHIPPQQSLRIFPVER